VRPAKMHRAIAQHCMRTLQLSELCRGHIMSAKAPGSLTCRTPERDNAQFHNCELMCKCRTALQDSKK
jgi:hypothetical protein